MTEKDYVTEDVARKLREKGFNEKCRGYYYNGVFCFSCFHNEYNKTNNASLVSAPSLAQAARWLRDEHAIWVTAFPEYDSLHELIVYRVRITGFWNLLENKKGELLSLWFEKYEQALNAGLKEALEMI